MRRCICKITILGVFGTLLASGEDAVSGHVLDENYVGLSNANVTLRNLADPGTSFAATSDKAGAFSFAEVPDGEYSLEASRRGFVGVRYSPVRVRYPRPIEKDLILRVAPGNEDGIQFQAEVVGELKINDKRLSHTKVCLKSEARERCTVTNGIGQYYLAVEPGRYDVLISVDNGESVRQVIDLPVAGEYRDKIKVGVR